MAPTQDALYAEIDLELSWSERDLPERERTKHVHRLHPYLGKFIPQLVETLLDRYLTPGGHVLDPFAGSGTTLVQALESGFDATGADIAAFNCLLMRVKTQRYNLFVLERELRDAAGQLESSKTGARPSRYMREWFAPQAARELLSFSERMDGYEHHDVLRVILARAARSARRTTHFDLDFPREPQLEPYWCHKHKRECRPVESANRFLRRYTLDTIARSRRSRKCARKAARRTSLHGDSRELDYGRSFDGLVTSPPYPGLIDYHEQHRTAYELLGLDDLRGLELGPAAAGTSRTAIAAYCDGSATCSSEREVPAARRTRPDRRERPPRSLPGDPRAGGPPARGEAEAPRQPAHRPQGRRVLRRRARRPRIRLELSATT